jgi:hypothetical protein
MKGADFFIPQSIQKKVQNKLDVFTLKLHYTNIFPWFTKHISLLMLFIVGLVAFIFISLILHFFSSYIYSEATIAGIFVSGVGLLIASTISIFFGTRDVFKRNFEYFVGKDFNKKKNHYSFNLFIKRTVSILKHFSIWLLLALFVVFIVIYCLNKGILYQDAPILVCLMALAFPFAIEFLGCFLCLIIIVGLLPLIFLLLQSIIRITLSICWKIVDYNKGAFAAINIILTVLLGLAELYLKCK